MRPSRFNPGAATRSSTSPAMQLRFMSRPEVKFERQEPFSAQLTCAHFHTLAKHVVRVLIDVPLSIFHLSPQENGVFGVPTNRDRRGDLLLPSAGVILAALTQNVSGWTAAPLPQSMT